MGRGREREWMRLVRADVVRRLLKCVATGCVRGANRLMHQDLSLDMEGSPTSSLPSSHRSRASHVPAAQQDPKYLLARWHSNTPLDPVRASPGPFPGPTLYIMGDPAWLMQSGMKTRSFLFGARSRSLQANSCKQSARGLVAVLGTVMDG